MKREIILTKDGSSTVAIPEMQVTYHSIYGAVQESVHVFIAAGLRYAFTHFSDTCLRIFEMGFGSGLNALLTAIEAEKEQRAVHYIGIEPFPLTPEEINTLNYGKVVNNEPLFQQLHQCAWHQATPAHHHFTLQKEKVALFNYSTDQPFHLLYYDAFAPTAQPQLWTQVVFEKLYKMLVPGGILVTYCAKGDVRRALQAAGFTVTKTPGPPGKREMLRAIALRTPT